MARPPSNRLALVQGTLDMLVLRTLLLGPAHGHEIAKHIQRTSDDLLQVEHGSLYPALHRLERKGWVTARWETARSRNREFKYLPAHACRPPSAGARRIEVETVDRGHRPHHVAGRGREERGVSDAA